MRLASIKDFKEILTEMPKNIDELRWLDFYDLNKNQFFFKQLKRDLKKELCFKINEQASVYRLKSTYFCLDDETKSITYFMSYQVGNNGKLGNYVWQSLVWRDDTVAYITGIPKKVFFDILLPRFGCILTDSGQTWDGQRFWKQRIANAFSMNLGVYFYDASTHRIVTIDSRQKFLEIDNSEDIWGDTDDHKMKRIVISNRKLPI